MTEELPEVFWLDPMDKAVDFVLYDQPMDETYVKYTRTSPQAESDDGALNQLGVIARAHTKLEALSAPQSAKDGERQAALADAVHVFEIAISATEHANVPKDKFVLPMFEAEKILETLRAALTAKPDEDQITLKRPLPDHDNHHNALLCPYCNPDGLVLAPKPDAGVDVEAIKEETEKFFDCQMRDGTVPYERHRRNSDYRCMIGKIIDHLYSSGRLSSKAEWQNVRGFVANLLGYHPTHTGKMCVPSMTRKSSTSADHNADLQWVGKAVLDYLNRTAQPPITVGEK